MWIAVGLGFTALQNKSEHNPNWQLQGKNGGNIFERRLWVFILHFRQCFVTVAVRNADRHFYYYAWCYCIAVRIGRIQAFVLNVSREQK
jgi:hypothetical protein